MSDQKLRQALELVLRGLANGSVTSRPIIDFDSGATKMSLRSLNQIIEEALSQPVEAVPVSAEQQSAHPHILEALSWHRFERDDMTLEEVVEVIRHGYRKVRGRTARQLELQLCELLAAAPAPVAGQGGIVATLGVMKESNGRVTYIVSLTREGAGPFDGHQVYSSQIQGRAQYEHAKLLHFLGQGPEPDILAYDTSAPAPVAPSERQG